MFSTYLADIILLLVAAVVVVPVFQKLKMGVVPGFLVAGVLVGPSGLGLINGISEISHLAEIGVVLLLFVIGIELKPARLWQMKRLVFGLGSLQVFFTGTLLSVVVYFSIDMTVSAAILIGPAMALSSTAFVLQLLAEQKKLHTVFGRTSLSVLLLQDLAVVPLLALVPLLASPDQKLGQDISLALLESIVILFLVVFVGRYLLHPILHRVALSGNPEIFTASAVLIVLGTALVTEHAGLSMAMGAFLAGLLIADSFYRHQVMAEIQPFRGLFLGLFFMSMGMSLDVRLFLQDPLVPVVMLLVLVILKILILTGLTLMFGLKKKNGLAVSLILAQSGEFALVLFSLANQNGIISSILFQQLLLVVLLSMLITPMLAYLANRQLRLGQTVMHEDEEKPEHAPIVLAGFGRVGRRIGEILKLAGESYVALDLDAALVERERSKGAPVFYGDVRKPDLLSAAGAQNARLVIVTLDDPVATEEIVTVLRHNYPDISIYARGHDLRQCQRLRKLGVTAAVSENVEASLELARMTLLESDADHKKYKKILSEFRRKYRAQIDEY